MMTRRINVGAGVILCWIGATAAALDVRQWAESAFVGKPTTSAPAPAGVEVRRQDHAVPQYGVSAVKTPLRIGDRNYKNGLGTHAFSQIVIRLPEPGQTFTAQVGVDNNRETAGKHGSVEFIVEVGGKEAYRSGVCRGGEAARAVKVELNGARELTLRVTDGADGTPYDQADWAEAGVTLSSGKQVLLDDMPLHLAPVRFAPRHTGVVHVRRQGIADVFARLDALDDRSGIGQRSFDTRHHVCGTCGWARSDV